VQVGGNSRLPAVVINESLLYVAEKHLRSGDRLPGEEELCTTLTALREAAGVLADRGLLTSIPGRWTFLTSLGASAASRAMSTLLLIDECTPWELCELRRLLEAHLSARAALCHTPARLADMISAIHR
jgi:DNA-binding FadR family transcriptional regulator